ncbi:CpaF family protein [Salmonella enterica]|nr:CpaF family protein [Salmonella enterica]EIE5598627.1 CpaF family protein [Salmonella enterica]EKI2475232.1 CpaF family protein [Salmonella enterica]EMB7587799.1 CpaF family protein [Salmonella enterica]
MKGKEYPFGYVEFLHSQQQNEYDNIEHDMFPIIDLYTDDDVTDIFINEYNNIWIVKDGKNIKVNNCFESESALSAWISLIAKTLKQPYMKTGDFKERDEIHPILDARFPNGSRIMATSPLITPKGTSVSLRKVPKKILTGDELIGFDYLTPEMMAYLQKAIRQKKNIVFVGNTGSGKTTLVRVMILFMDRGIRIITVEDTAELNVIDHFPLGIAFEAPVRKNVAADLATCITATKRAQPDCVVVGEIRTPTAMYAYYDVCTGGTVGNITTMHATSPKKAIIKMAIYLMKAGGFSFELAEQLIREEVDIIVQCRRDPEYGRRVSEITEVHDTELRSVFSFDKETQTFRDHR